MSTQTKLISNYAPDKLCVKCNKTMDRNGRYCAECRSKTYEDSMKKYKEKRSNTIICDICGTKLSELSVTNHLTTKKHKAMEKALQEKLNNK